MRGKRDLLILNCTKEICALVNLLIVKNNVNYIRSLLSKAVGVIAAWSIIPPTMQPAVAGTFTSRRQI